MKYALPYAVALVIFLLLDFAWIGLTGRSFYAERMGSLLAERPNFGYAALFYILYVAGLIYFAVSPGLKSGNASGAAFKGALYGFFCYMTYNLTDLSILKNYDALVAAVDTGWGTVSGAIIAGVTVVLVKLFRRKAA